MDDPRPEPTASLRDYDYGISELDLHRMRQGLAAYIHLERCPDDPDRRTRGREHSLGLAPHRSLAQIAPATLRDHLWEALGALGPSSFHRLCIELHDIGADVAFGGPIERELFGMVPRRCVAMTPKRPILFCRTVDLLGVEDAQVYTPGATTASTQARLF